MKPPSMEFRFGHLLLRRFTIVAILVLGISACTADPPVDERDVREDYRYGQDTLLGTDPQEFEIGSAGSVWIPGATPGTITRVAVATQVDFVDVDLEAPALTDVVAIRLQGDLDLRSDVVGAPPVMVVTMQPTASNVQSVGLSTIPTAVSLVRIRASTATDSGSWVDLAGEAALDAATGDYTVSIVDPATTCNALTSSTAAKASGCEIAAKVVDIGQIFDDVWDRIYHGPIHQRVGLHKIDAAGFVDAGADCSAKGPWPWLQHDSEREKWEIGHRSAVVFVHGWLTFGGLSSLKAGDTRAIAAHCDTWSTFLTGVGSSGGPWREIHDDSDVFVFRYDSDKRVGLNAGILADRLHDLRNLGYERVVLVGHSMGGLVVHDARQIDRERGRAPDPSDMRVVTLATPYMGSVLLCTEWDAHVCKRARPSLVDIVNIVLVAGLPGTLDLSSGLYLNNGDLYRLGHVSGGRIRPYRQNPYLARLWIRASLADPNTTAFIGTNAMSPFVTDGWLYGNTHKLLRDGGWGFSDGIVPLASGLGSATLAYNPTARLMRTVEYGRDHTLMAKGCTTENGCPRTGHMRDPYLDAVASTIADNLLPAAPAFSIAGSLTPSPTGNWRVSVLYPNLVDPYATSFNAIGGSAPLVNGTFDLDISPITPPPVPFVSPNVPPSATLDPPSTIGATFSLVAFNDANDNQQLDPGETIYEINDLSNTFGSGALILEYADRPYTITGASQTSTGTPVQWSVDSAGTWGRTIYRTIAGGTAIEVTNDHRLNNLQLTLGRQGTIGTNSVSPLTTPSTPTPRGIFHQP